MPKGVYERTSEMKAAMSAAQKGIPKSPDHCSALSKSLKGIPLSPERIAAMKNSTARKDKADAQRGIPLSPEHRDAISEASRNSESVKAKADLQRGGNDIVNHHYIYDHDNLSKYTIEMTRSDHSRLHALLRKLKYIVPHINIKEI